MTNAMTIMVFLMLPAFMFAMYEKDGMHLEDILMHVLNVKFFRPSVRTYETENYYETDSETSESKNEKGGSTSGKKKK